MNQHSDTNTIERLRRLAPIPGEVSDDVVQQDLARGRIAALQAHRKQVWLAGGVGGFALAAIVGAGAILPSVHSVTTTQAGSASQADHSVMANPAMKLVSYTGAQPNGYRLGKVPAGFTVEASDEHDLILVPTGRSGLSPAEGMVDYTGKIVISQQGSFTYTKDKREVTINGEPAVIALSDGAYPATEVQFTTGGHTVNIQIWHTISLTDPQIVDFAQNITVTGNPTIAGG